METGFLFVRSGGCFLDLLYVETVERCEMGCDKMSARTISEKDRCFVGSLDPCSLVKTGGCGIGLSCGTLDCNGEKDGAAWGGQSDGTGG